MVSRFVVCALPLTTLPSWSRVADSPDTSEIFLAVRIWRISSVYHPFAATVFFYSSLLLSGSKTTHMSHKIKTLVTLKPFKPFFATNRDLVELYLETCLGTIPQSAIFDLRGGIMCAHICASFVKVTQYFTLDFTAFAG